MDIPRRHNITIIPKTVDIKRVGIYCRVSSARQEQLHSLSMQISGLTRKVFLNEEWRLYDIYFDVKSGATATSRPEFQRLLSDCEDGLIDIVIIKSVSRLGRDTVEVMDAVAKLVERNVLVLFDNEQFCTDDPKSRLFIAAAVACAQAENEMRSNSADWAISQRLKDGTSALYDRKCYGYTHNDEGRLTINPDEAPVVEWIFSLYLKGYSVRRIQVELFSRGIKSPTGKDQWCKRTIEFILSNDKYTGDVTVLKYQSTKKNPSRKPMSMYTSEDDHPAIISKEVFAAVQAEKERRSNVIRDEHGVRRKSTKYSSLSAVKEGNEE